MGYYSKPAPTVEEMQSIDTDNVYRKAIDTWGNEAQLTMVVEELSELQLAVLHYLRGRATYQEIAEEIADVEIMLEQLKVMIPELHSFIPTFKEYKLKRLEERLNGK